MEKESRQKAKRIKRASQIVLIHVVLIMVLFSNEPFRFDGPHQIVYDTLVKKFLDVRFTYGLFGYPRAQNTRVTCLVKYASGKSIDWSPVDLEHTPYWEKGHEAIMRNWLDENIGDHGVKTDKLLLHDAAAFAARNLAKADDQITEVQVCRTLESIPPPGSTEAPAIMERTTLYTLIPGDQATTK